jgi:hypothetical protein
VSICRAGGANPGARILSVGGKRVSQMPDEFGELRRAVAWAPTPAHFVAAQRRLEEAEIRARWLN